MGRRIERGSTRGYITNRRGGFDGHKREKMTEVRGEVMVVDKEEAAIYTTEEFFQTPLNKQTESATF